MMFRVVLRRVIYGGAMLSGLALVLTLIARRRVSALAVTPADPVETLSARVLEAARVQTPPPQPPLAAAPRVRWLVFAALLVAILLLSVLLPHDIGRLLFVLLVAGSLTYAGRNYRRAIYRQLRALADEIRLSLRRTPAAVDTLAAISVRQAIAEIAVIAVVALFATSPFLDGDPYLRLPGGEVEWLTSSAHFASNSLREYGYIPLWQPYLDNGEPLIDNPFSFVLNPISAGPTLLFGGLLGIRISVVLYTVLVGVGGWLLGRSLGFGALGRMLLGLLLVGKGNMLAMIGTGYYQLGVTQAYFPWIIAATVAALRNHGRRWPVVLLAVSFALMFTAGNIWYTLPMLLAVVAFGAAHILDRKVDWQALGRLLLAGALTIGLSAVILLPVWGNRELHTGMHPDEEDAGWVVDPARVIAQYYTTDTIVYTPWDTYGEPQFYYSFVAPLGIFVAVFGVLPLVWFVLLKPNPQPSPLARPWRIWSVAILMLVIATVWGSGGNPIMVWLYDHIPVLRQWRFVGRALAVGSFWLAVLLAARADGLWRAMLVPDWRDWVARLAPPIRLRQDAMLVMVALVGAVAYQVYDQWKSWGVTEAQLDFEDVCLYWLREREPDRPLAVYRVGYEIIDSFLNNRVRLHDIEADYQALPQPSTIGQVNLLGVMPEYAMAWDTITRHFLIATGYRQVPDTPRGMDGRPCLYRNPNVLSYAFTVSKLDLQSTYSELPPELTTPVTTLERYPDRIRLWVNGDAMAIQVLTVQEVAFPGWRVTMDGQPARLEVVGGQIGVTLPRDESRHEVIFEYHPPLLYQGGAITLATCLFCVPYLLRADRLIRRLRRNI
jgi:hypothetical protein